GRVVPLPTNKPVDSFLVGFSPDGRVLLAVSGGREALHAWDVRRGKPLWVFRPKADFLDAFAFSPDSRTVAVLERRVIRLRDPRTGKMLRACKGTLALSESMRRTLSFSTDGRLLAAADGQSLRLWSGSTGEELRTPVGHTDRATDLAFSLDGRTA